MENDDKIVVGRVSIPALISFPDTGSVVRILAVTVQFLCSVVKVLIFIIT